MFETLPGFRAFYPDSCSIRNTLFAVWRETATRFSFEEYDAPILEPLELYIEKSGPEIVGQLFNFEDRGGRAVALRPEMTPSLARLVGARANGMKRPVKWFSIGENFRYERPQKGRTRSFYQFNADILGDESAGADAELLMLLIATLRRFGLNEADFFVRLSDRQLWLAYLAARGLAEAEAFEVLSVVDKLERMAPDEALSRMAGIVADPEVLLGEIRQLVQARTLEDIEKVLFQVAADETAKAAVQLRLGDLRLIMARLAAAGLSGYLEIDLGIVRGLAYYTGFVFEAFERSGDSRALAGGGRYDNLVKKIGGPDLAAVGFAIGDVTLTDCLVAKGLIEATPMVPSIYCVVGGEAEMQACVADVYQLRQQGFRVDYPFKVSSFGKQFKNAEKSGARFVIVYGESELETGLMTVKDLSTGESVTVPRLGLAAWLGSHLA